MKHLALSHNATRQSWNKRCLYESEVMATDNLVTLMYVYKISLNILDSKRLCYQIFRRLLFSRFLNFC